MHRQSQSMLCPRLQPSSPLAGSSIPTAAATLNSSSAVTSLRAALTRQVAQALRHPSAPHLKPLASYRC